MAKQVSITKFRGKIGDLSFSKHRTRGYEARTPGGADKQRIMTDPNFQRTRENMAEFGSATSMAKLIRLQLASLLNDFGDGNFRNRLTSVVHRIQKTDAEGRRGERTFKPENSRPLIGLEFNERSSLSVIFKKELTTSYDRATGLVELIVPGFDPQASITAVAGATHVQFVLAAVEQTLDNTIIPYPTISRSGYISLTDEYAGETLQAEVPAQSEKVVYIMVGIALVQRVNQGFYPLLNEGYNAMTIVDVDIP